MNTKLVFSNLLIFFLFFFPVQLLIGQEKYQLVAGIGIPEGLNVGMKYQINQSQIGLSIGTYQLGSENHSISLTSDYYYHFGGHSNFTNLRPWYSRIGLSYLRLENEYEKDQYFFLNPRVGRDFHFSNRMGMFLDIGVYVILHYDEKDIKPSGSWLNFKPSDLPVFPIFGMGLFYKF